MFKGNWLKFGHLLAWLGNKKLIKNLEIGMCTTINGDSLLHVPLFLFVFNDTRGGLVNTMLS